MQGVTDLDYNKNHELAAMKKGLMEQEEALGPDNKETLRTVNGIGLFLQVVEGKLKEAETYFRRSLEGHERTLGREDHQATLTAVNNLGHLLQAQGKLSLAEPYLRRAFEGNERTLVRDHTTARRSSRGGNKHCRCRKSKRVPHLRRIRDGHQSFFGGAGRSARPRRAEKIREQVRETMNFSIRHLHSPYGSKQHTTAKRI